MKKAGNETFEPARDGMLQAKTKNRQEASIGEASVMHAAISAEHMKKDYGEFALDFSMEVMPGRITGLVGRNGAGKTTVFKGVLGLISTGGNVSTLGRDASLLTAADRERIGVVFADSGFNEDFWIKDIESIMKGLYRNFDEKKFRELAAGLPADKPIKKFSNGMSARLKLIAALTHGAELLILDEPTAGLDVIARDELLDMLRDFMAEDERRAVLISSHISSDLEGLCDDIYMIHEGSCILHEDMDALLDRYALLKLDADTYEKLDKSYILTVKTENYGVSCLTDQKQFYAENYPQLAIEKGSIDSVFSAMVRGKGL